MGYCMDIGKYFGSDNLGVGLYVIPQFIICIVTIAYGFNMMDRWKSPIWLRAFAILFFSLCPIIPMYAVMEIKDTYYYIVFLWIIYILTMEYQNIDRNYVWFIIAILICVMCMLRNEGKYVCLLSCVVLIIARKRTKLRWKKCLVSMITGIIMATVITSGLCKIYNIQDGSIREALSVPIQQTARYMRNHEDDVTEYEWKILDDIFDGNAHELGDVYEPNRADAAKWKMVYYPTHEQLKNYFIVWMKQFIKHPATYIAAAFNEMYGYVYIEKPEYYGGGFSLGNPSDSSIVHGDIMPTNNPRGEKIRSYIWVYSQLWNNLPVINMLYHPATFMWIIFITMGFVLKSRKYGELSYFAFPIGNFLICCVSPVNGAVRYTLPVIYSCFILMAFTCYIRNYTNNVEDEQQWCI